MLYAVRVFECGKNILVWITGNDDKGRAYKCTLGTRGRRKTGAQQLMRRGKEGYREEYLYSVEMERRVRVTNT